MLITLLGLFVSPGQAQWTNGQNALLVIGQPDFTSGAAGLSATTLNTPKDVAIDLVHGKLYLLDSGNHRVLRFAYPVTSNQPTAELVFGQPDFNSYGTGASQNTFNAPRGIAVDSTGRLWVSEQVNARVVWFNAAYSLNTNQPSADGVLGQPDFISNTQTLSQTGMVLPGRVSVDQGGQLVVSEGSGANRVLILSNAAAKFNGDPADFVIGQPDFTTQSSGTTQNKLNLDSSGGGLAIDYGNNLLLIADDLNNRVMIFQAPNRLYLPLILRNP